MVRGLANQQLAMTSFLQSQEERAAKMELGQSEMSQQLFAHGRETQSLYQATADINHKLTFQEARLLEQNEQRSTQQRRAESWYLELQLQSQNIISEISQQHSQQNRLSQEVLSNSERYQDIESSVDRQFRVQDERIACSSLGKDGRGKGKLRPEAARGSAEEPPPSYQYELPPTSDDPYQRRVSFDQTRREEPDNDPKTPMRRNSEGMSILTVNPTAKAPPKFTHENYHRWGEEVSFWREIHAFADDKTLIAELALGSHDLLRSILATYLRETKESKEERTPESLFKILGREFQKKILLSAPCSGWRCSRILPGEVENAFVRTGFDFSVWWQILDLVD